MPAFLVLFLLSILGAFWGRVSEQSISHKSGIPDLQSGLESLILIYFLGVCFASETNDLKACFTLVLYRRKKLCRFTHVSMSFRLVQYVVSTTVYIWNFSIIY